MKLLEKLRGLFGPRKKPGRPAGAKKPAPQKKPLKIAGPDAKLTAAEKRRVKRSIQKAQRDGKIPRDAVQTIPYRELFPDGLMQVNDKLFTKTLRFSDINYELAQPEDKEQTFDGLCDFYNALDSSMWAQMSFLNLRANLIDYRKSVTVPGQGDGCDDVRREPGQYEKTSFRIDFTFNGALDSYEGRQDFGDGDGGLIDHIQSYREFYAKDEQWKDYVLRNDGPEALEKDTAQRETALTEFVPYLRLHCNLTQMERAADDVLAVVAKIEEPDGLDRTNAAYYGAVQAYVTECRGQLNTGAYQLPEAPKKEDFIDPEYQAYREQVREEVKQEAAAAGLTVEQYAANGYEPRSSSQPVQEPTGTPAMDAIEAKVQRGEAVSLMAMVDAAKSDRAAGRAGKKPSVHDTLEAAKKAPAKPRKPRTKKAPAKDGPERS